MITIDFIAVLWWGAYGGLAYELQCLAKRIVSLCCSASGCERNWSTFAHVSSATKFHLASQMANLISNHISIISYAGPYQKEEPFRA